MKSMIVVALALVAIAVALPAEDPVKIIRSNYDQTPDGSYNYGYESEDGNNRQETGELKQALDDENKPHDVIVVRGSYGYIDPDGNPQSVNYIADETGFHAEGSSIPKSSSR